MSNNCKCEKCNNYDEQEDKRPIADVIREKLSFMTKDDIERGFLRVTFSKHYCIHDVCGEVKGKILLYNRITDVIYSITDENLNECAEAIIQQASPKNIPFTAETVKVGQIWEGKENTKTYTIIGITKNKTSFAWESHTGDCGWTQFKYAFLDRLVQDVD